MPLRSWTPPVERLTRDHRIPAGSRRSVSAGSVQDRVHLLLRRIEYHAFDPGDVERDARIVLPLVIGADRDARDEEAGLRFDVRRAAGLFERNRALEVGGVFALLQTQSDPAGLDAIDGVDRCACAYVARELRAADLPARSMAHDDDALVAFVALAIERRGLDAGNRLLEQEERDIVRAAACPRRTDEYRLDLVVAPADSQRGLRFHLLD